MEATVLLVLAAVGLCLALAYRLLLVAPEDREAFWLLLLKRFRRAPASAPEPLPAPPPPPPPSSPPPEPEPEPEIGNVRPDKSEWDKPPELANAYLFPQRMPPVTRYEDLNRRLFVFTPGTNELKGGKLPVRSIDDHPIAISCTSPSLMRAVKSQLRCAYPVIIDPLGWFAKASRTLERNPYGTSPLIEAYLAIPESARPVVISNAQAAESAKSLVFSRYQFKDLHLNVEFLEPYAEQSVAYVFQQFLKERDEWLWFSPARLRHHVTELNRPMEEAKARLQEVLSTNNFALLWKLRLDQQSQIPPSQSVTDEALRAAE